MEVAFPTGVGLSRHLAALCALSPIEASSGRTVRHRLNRGGDRQVNNAQPRSFRKLMSSRRVAGGRRPLMQSR